MAKSKARPRKSQEDEELSLNQGFVKDSDLESKGDDVKIMKSREVDRYAKAAESKNRPRAGAVQGEGDYEAAESYNEAATDFAQQQKDNS